MVGSVAMDRNLLVTLLIWTAILGCIVIYQFYTINARFHAMEIALSSLQQHDETAISTKSPPALPSIRLNSVEESMAAKARKYYGGRYDRMHLGGFMEYDNAGTSNNTFNFMLSELGIKSFLDIGCGRGISTEFFRQHGADVLCVEGSHDAYVNSYLPKHLIVEHDYTRGPWWPEKTYDAAWSVEFLEHVGRQFMPNYLPTFQRAALLFVTSSIFGGWHHTEVRLSWWWKSRFEAAGFVFSSDLTALVRQYAVAGKQSEFDSQHICMSMLVFINPAVARLPQHAHLFGGHGCVWGDNIGIPCTKGRYKWFSEVDIPPPRYESLITCDFNKKNKIFHNCTRNQ